jgi:hypothetical protein
MCAHAFLRSAEDTSNCPPCATTLVSVLPSAESALAGAAVWLILLIVYQLGKMAWARVARLDMIFGECLLSIQIFDLVFGRHL